MRWEAAAPQDPHYGKPPPVVRAVIQRVSSAAVEADGTVVGAIGYGLLILVGVTHHDDQLRGATLARKIHGLRILDDERSLADLPHAAALVVSQFTLYGDARKGRRPTWAAAAPGPMAEPLVAVVVQTLRDLGTRVETGSFGAQMRVTLVNEGPLTLIVDI